MVGLALLADPVLRDLYRALARRALRWESGSAIIDWANEALLAGRDTRPLAILAGLDKPPNEFETDMYLAAALRSLGLEMPATYELIRLLALILAGDMVSGATSLKAGCSELSRLAGAAGYPSWLENLCNADDALSLAEGGVIGNVEEVTQRILNASRQLLEASVEDDLDGRERLEALVREIRLLPEELRLAFQLVWLEGRGIAETAAVLGTTTLRVKVRVHRAREKLRNLRPNSTPGRLPTADPRYPDDFDLAWLASDREGHVAAFVTGGAGPIPRKAFEPGRVPVEDLEERVHNLPRSSGARVLVDFPSTHSIVALAELGLYVYDWSDAHRTSPELVGAYQPVGVPTRPIGLDAIGEELAALFRGISLDLAFADGSLLDVAKHLPCLWPPDSFDASQHPRDRPMERRPLATGRAQEEVMGQGGARPHHGVTCSFCGKGQREVRKLIAGPQVNICDACIELCSDILVEEAGDRQLPPRAEDAKALSALLIKACEANPSVPRSISDLAVAVAAALAKHSNPPDLPPEAQRR
jgi:hypothetical protein